MEELKEEFERRRNKNVYEVEELKEEELSGS